MILLTYLCLVLSTTQLLADNVPELVYRYTRFTPAVIVPSNLVIPKNSHLKGIPGTIKGDWRYPQTWMYDWIEYKRDISEFTAINRHYFISYKIQYRSVSSTSFWNSIFSYDPDWIDYGVSEDALCSDSQDSIGNVIHLLLGIIKEGCPVSANEKRNTKGIVFPLKMRSLLLFEEIPESPLRILFGVHSGGKNSELLFTGILYLETPGSRVIEYH